MKNLSLSLLLVWLFLGLTNTADGRAMGTSLTGIVQAVDHATRWITFTQEDGSIRQFVYTGQTRFWHGENEARPAHLKPGMKVRVQLHHPFFGPDFVSNIVLLSPPLAFPRR